ncbi:type II toxin-antitoxin system RelE/ParE family toxin [Methylocystis sp.]|uniref:type II toxin-antitoxin system RelE/ParE family toxin n=1 Tax=Methylocystis sp. TaxID=1911079 RepID=UPI00396473CF
MRTLRYTPRSVAQIEKAIEYVAAESPQRASNIRARLLTILAMLREPPTGAARCRYALSLSFGLPRHRFGNYRFAVSSRRTATAELT